MHSGDLYKCVCVCNMVIESEYGSSFWFQFWVEGIVGVCWLHESLLLKVLCLNGQRSLLGFVAEVK